jgi:hypothetical protein
MTVKAILFGLLGVVGLNGFTYFNDHVLHQPQLISNFLPISVYGAFIIFVLVINPGLRFLGRRAFFTGRELAVVLCLVLTSACIPGSSLMRTFTNVLVMPHHLEKSNPEWQEEGVLEMVPDAALVDVGGNEGTVVNGFVSGMSRGRSDVPFSSIPWGAFRSPLKFWLPMIIALWLGLIGLSMVVHRQWSRHEHLPYPLARFVNELMPGDNPGESLGSRLLHNRVFWLGLAIVFAIHGNNYFALWMDHWVEPGTWITVKTELGLNALRGVPILNIIADNQGGLLFKAPIYFSVVAFGYFLAKEVSLSLGIGPVLYIFVIALYRNVWGVAAGKSTDVAYGYTMGAYLAVALAVFYMGRTYYRQVVRRAFMLRGGDASPPEAVWGCRLFLASLAAFVVLVIRTGVDWQISVLLAGVLIVLFLVMSRIVAETGVFFVQAGILPVSIILMLFGEQAVGPRLVLLLSMITAVLAVDLREALMPFFVNSLRVLDVQKVKVSRGMILGIVAVLLGLAVAIPSTIYLQYKHGNDTSDSYATKTVPKQPFDRTVTLMNTLKSQGKLEEAQSIGGWQRFTRIGFALVILFTAARLRFPNWPLHPALFLIWATYPAMHMAVSFMLGWFIKAGVTKYGGAGAYRKLQPLMFGVIAGDMLGGALAVIVGIVYFLINGEPPPIKAFRIFVG